MKLAEKAMTELPGAIVGKSAALRVFAKPDLDSRPMARMWFPDAGAGAVENDCVEEQLRSMAAGGIGGVEVALLGDDTGNLDAENYGVEGETYTLDENGDPQYTDMIINNPDGLSYFFASYVYATNAASGMFPYMNDMSKTFYDFNDNQWQVYEDLKNLSDCAYNYPTYATMDTEESSEYSELENEISTYADTCILQFITGATDIDEGFDDFVDTLYDMGAQELIDLKQAAYDRAMQRLEILGLS